MSIRCITIKHWNLLPPTPSWTKIRAVVCLGWIPLWPFHPYHKDNEQLAPQERAANPPKWEPNFSIDNYIYIYYWQPLVRRWTVILFLIPVHLCLFRAVLLTFLGIGSGGFARGEAIGRARVLCSGHFLERSVRVLRIAVQSSSGAVKGLDLKGLNAQSRLFYREMDCPVQRSLATPSALESQSRCNQGSVVANPICKCRCHKAGHLQVRVALGRRSTCV